MATRASQADRRQDAETARDQRAEMEQPEERETGEEEQGEQRQLARADQRRPAPRRRPEPGEVFDARAATRVGLLRLARNWRETGSAYQAIHAYTEVLVRYPGTGAASAAAEELVGLAEALEREGRFYTALNIFNKLEQLL